MDCLLRSRFLQQLSFLTTQSQQLVISYLGLLHARHYAQGSLEAVIVAIKRFIWHLPPPRRDLLTTDLTQATAVDLDCLIAALQVKGLAPSTINLTLSLLRDFFAFLVEDGQMSR